jgi:hypothetical protein
MIRCYLVFAFFACGFAFSQRLLAQSINLKQKLSKTDKISFAAYDDTTQALAQLFIAKRHTFNQKQEINYWIVGVSAATFVAGGILLQQDLNEPNATYNPTNYAGLVLMFVSSGGMIYSTASSLLNFLRLNPYTLRKYERLLVLYQKGEPIPRFYQKRLVKFLR